MSTSSFYSYQLCFLALRLQASHCRSLHLSPHLPMNLASSTLPKAMERKKLSAWFQTRNGMDHAEALADWVGKELTEEDELAPVCMEL